jgi:MFS family permease
MSPVGSEISQVPLPGPDHEAAIPPSADTRSGVFSWYPASTGTERRTFWICYAGHLLDAMDIQFYSFAIPSILLALSLTNGQAGQIASAALIASAIGGWAAGIAADRIGRVRTLQITIAWFALFSLLSSFAQGYNSLFFTRSLLGFGFGGETAVSAILMAEMIAPAARGRAVGLVQSAWATGSIATAICSAAAFTVFPLQTGWRVLFGVGVAPALLILAIRRSMPEPAIYLRSRAIRGKAANPLLIFSRAHLRTTIATTLVATGILGGNFAFNVWLPTFLRNVRHLSVFGTGGYLIVLYVGALLGYITGAYLTDRIGRKLNFAVFALCAVAILEIYTQLPISDPAMLVLGFPLGFFSSGILAGVGSFFSELYPTAIRGSGQAFAFNGGRALGALFPALVGIFANRLPLGTVIGTIGIAPYVLMLFALLVLPETRGQPLDRIDPHHTQ